MPFYRRSPQRANSFPTTFCGLGSQWAVVKHPKDNAFKLRRLLNCNSNTTAELAACLKNVPAEQIVQAQGKLGAWRYTVSEFAPVVEPSDAIEPFQNEDPYIRWHRGDVNKVPLVAGFTRDDGLSIFAGFILLDKVARDELNNKWNDIAPIFYLYDDWNVTSEDRDSISSSIRAFYLDGKTDPNEIAAGFVHSDTDRYFALGPFEEAKLHSKVAPVYQYLFSFVGDFSFTTSLLGLNYIATGHLDDAIYIFASDDAPLPELSPRAKDFSQQFVKLWVSFMRDGQPDPSAIHLTSWEQFTTDDQNTLRLDMPAEVLKNVNSDRMGFGESLKLRQLQFPDTK